MGFDHKNQVPLGLLTPSQSLSPSWVGIPLTQCDGPRWLWYVVAAAVLALGLRPSATGDAGSISFRVRARWVKQKDLINWKMCVRTGEDALNDAFDGSFANGSGISGLKPRGHHWRFLSITDQIAA